MATKHGNRVYIQVLLEPFRGELFMQEAKAQGIKPSALIRQLVYNYLAENTDENTYCEALASDKQKWQDAVDSRLEGRRKMRNYRMTGSYSDPSPQETQSDQDIDSSN
jgi:hypothetical protein